MTVSAELCHVCYGYRLAQSPDGVVTQLLDVQYSSTVSNPCDHTRFCYFLVL